MLLGMGEPRYADLADQAAWEIWQAACADRDKVIAELVAIANKLNGYASHDEDCDINTYSECELRGCSCGYTDTWVKLHKAQGE